ncbi:hypothetical protein CKA32_001176 [Geitlerinema sp. FC II]|nr:hypothetical protein CKA32_001176 [Geitlerinema sp. FC II]
MIKIQSFFCSRSPEYFIRLISELASNKYSKNNNICSNSYRQIEKYF